jgi:hypothetical protein
VLNQGGIRGTGEFWRDVVNRGASLHGSTRGMVNGARDGFDQGLVRVSHDHHPTLLRERHPCPQSPHSMSTRTGSPGSNQNSTAGKMTPS